MRRRRGMRGVQQMQRGSLDEEDLEVEEVNIPNASN